MKIMQRETAVAAYYEHVIPSLAQSQNSRVMAVIRPGKDYSLTELVELTGIDKSSISRCVNNLRAAGLLVTAPERKCSYTGIRITPSRLPSKQGDFFS